MINLRRIGVIGGMGPEATVALMQRIQARTPARDDADHVPLLVDMNPQVPSRILHLIEKSGPNPGPVMAQMATRLQIAGAEALILPCNTAHYYADYITDSVQVPFLNMPEMTCAAIAQHVEPNTNVGILASPATHQTGLFQKLLAQHKLETLWPEDEPSVLAIIQRIKSKGVQPADIEQMQEKTDELVRNGASAVLVGCTEFSLISDQLNAPVPVVDALDVLVAATLKFSGVTEQ